MVRSILLNLTGGEMVNFREAFKISIAFVGVVVGAGFASGQEIMQFFTSFGMVGLVGAVISGALFIFLALALSTLGQQKASLSHKRVTYAICGKYFGLFVYVLITSFMFAISLVMLVGPGSFVVQ